MIKFVDSSADGLPVKRKQTLKACDACRKRKKRCHHDSESSDTLSSLKTRSRTIADNQVEAPELDTPASVNLSTGSQDRDYSEPSANFRGQYIEASDTLSTRTDARTSAASGARVQQQAIGVQISDVSKMASSGSALHSHGDRQSLEQATNSQNVASPGIEASDASDSERGGDQSRFLGHTNPEGMFLEVTSPNGARTIGSDTIGVWLPRQTYEKVQKGSKVESTYANRQRRIYFSQDPFVSKVLLPYLTDQSIRLIPDIESFIALRTIYERDVHPVFPILAIDSVSQWNSVSDLSPARVLLMQSLCLSVAAAPAAQPYLRLPSTGSSLLAPKDFAATISQAMLTSLDMFGSPSRTASIRALSTLSLFLQLSNDDHSSAEYCARAVSYVQTLQIHLSTSRFRKDHQAVTRLFLCVWALDRLNAVFHGRPVLMHSRDLGRDMKTTIAEQEPSFRLFLGVVELLDAIISIYRPVVDSPDLILKDQFPSFEDMVVDSGAVKCSSHLIATIETLYHSVAMLSCRFDSLEDPDRSSASYLRQTLSATRLISLLGTEPAEGLSIFPFVPYAISLCLRVSYRDLRLSKAAIHRTRAKSQLQTACELLSKYRKTFAFADRMVDLAKQTIQEMDKVSNSISKARTRDREGIHRNQDPGRGGILSKDILTGSDSLLGHDTASDEIETTISGSFVPQYPPNPNIDFDFDDSTGMDIFDYFDPDFNLDAIDAALAQNVSADALPDFDFASDTGFTPGNPYARDSRDELEAIQFGEYQVTG